MGKIQKHRSSGRSITNTNTTRFSEADIDVEINKLVDSSVSVNTKETYRTGLVVFEAFRKLYNYDIIWPPLLESLKALLLHVTILIAYMSLETT